MAKLRRMEQAGAVFTEDFNSISSLKKRSYSSSGIEIVNSPIGKAIDFTGSVSYLSLAGNQTSKYNFNSENFSVSFWMFHEDTGVTDIMVAKGNNQTSDQSYWHIRFNEVGDKLRFIVSSANDVNANWYDSNTTCNINTWYHVTATWNYSTRTMKLYINGTEEGQSTTSAGGSPVVASSGDFVIGNQNTAATYSYNGKLANLCLFNRVLTASEALSLSKNQPFDYEKNVVSEWDMSNINPPDVGWRYPISKINEIRLITDGWSATGGGDTITSETTFTASSIGGF